MHTFNGTMCPRHWWCRPLLDGLRRCNTQVDWKFGFAFVYFKSLCTILDALSVACEAVHICHVDQGSWLIGRAQGGLRPRKLRKLTGASDNQGFNVT